MIGTFVGLIFGIMLIDMLILSEIKTALIKVDHALLNDRAEMVGHSSQINLDGALMVWSSPDQPDRKLYHKGETQWASPFTQKM